MFAVPRPHQLPGQQLWEWCCAYFFCFFLRLFVSPGGSPIFGAWRGPLGGQRWRAEGSLKPSAERGLLGWRKVRPLHYTAQYRVLSGHWRQGNWAYWVRKCACVFSLVKGRVHLYQNHTTLFFCGTQKIFWRTSKLFFFFPWNGNIVTGAPKKPYGSFTYLNLLVTFGLVLVNNNLNFWLLLTQICYFIFFRRQGLKS